MGKAQKIAIFIHFHPLNLKTEKNEIAYHVGNVATKIFQKIYKKKIDFDIIMTS